MPFGNEAKDFMAALGAGMNIQSDMARMAYSRQATRRARMENDEYDTPEARANRAKTARAAADKAGYDAETARAQSQVEGIKAGEYADPANAGLRQREREATVSNEESVAGANQLTYDEKKYDYFRKISPRGQQLTDEAEEAARVGNWAAAQQKMGEAEKLAQETWALQREHAAQTKAWYLGEGKEPPAWVETRLNEQPPPMLSDMAQRYGVNLNQPLPPSTQPQAVPAAPRSGSGPRGLRNNNPGNIEYGPFTQKYGATGSDGRFATFNSPEEGIAAMHGLLANYQRQGRTTVRQMISKWAPASDNNNVSAYANAVAGAMGIDPDTPFDFSGQNAANMVAAMIQHENGQQPYNMAQLGGTPGAAAPQQVAQNTPQQAVPASQPAGPQMLPMPSPMSEPTTTGSIGATAAPAADTDFHANREEMVQDGARALFPQQPGAVATSDQQAGQRAVLMGDGAKDPEAAQQQRSLFQTWDDDSLTPQQNGLIGDVAMYRWAKAFHPDKAQAYAREALQTMLNEANKYRSFAQAAAGAGDNETALKALATSFGYIPNGVDAQIEKQDDGDYAISFMRGGKQIHQEIVNPDNLLANVMKMTPKDSIDALYRFAGIENKAPSEAFTQFLSPGTAEGPGQYMGAMPATPREVGQQSDYAMLPDEGGLPDFAGMKPSEITPALAVAKARGAGAGGGRKPFSPGDQATVRNDVDEAWGQLTGSSVLNKAVGNDLPNLVMPQRSKDAIAKNEPWLKRLAAQIVQHGGDIDAQNAMSMALRMFDVREDQPFDRPFDVGAYKNGDRKITMKDGSGSFRLDKRNFQHIDDQRWEVEKAIWDAQQTTTKEGGQASSTEAEAGRRGAPAPLGAAPLVDYEGYRQWWFTAHPEYAGGSVGMTGDYGEQLERMIQQDWARYQQQGAGGIGHR